MIIQATQGDIGVPFNFTVTDKSGNAVDLTGGSVTLFITPSIPVNGGGVGQYDCVITDAVNGVATYTTTGNEFPTGNIKYLLQVKAVAGGKTLSSDIVSLFIRPQISSVNFPYLGY